MPSFTLSLIATTKLPLTKDFASGAAQIKTRFASIRLRSLGTNTYIALGDVAAQDFRFTVVGDTMNIEAMQGEKDLVLNELWVLGDGATGVLEVFYK